MEANRFHGASPVIADMAAYAVFLLANHSTALVAQTSRKATGEYTPLQEPAI